jgi:hypothetical protein
VTPHEENTSTCPICDVSAQCRIPYGTCHCGCGGRTNIAAYDWPPSGSKRGFPCKYIKHHHGYIVRMAEDALPFKIEGVYCRLIPIGKGFYVIVNEERYAHFIKYKYYSIKTGPRYTAYAARFDRETKRHIYMHNEILPPPEGHEVDHRNRNGLDNRDLNLRIATPTQQAANTRVPIDSKSGYKGIRQNGKSKRWKVRIVVNGKEIWLGSYLRLEDAISARAAAERLYFGEFANAG